MNIVYYMGAGASANAIPTIEGLAKSFNAVRHCLSTVRPTPEYQKSKLALDEVLRKAEACSRLYGTVDTYAKKLSFTNPKELSKLKAALAIYFTFWQEVLKDDIINEVYSKIDSRYFGLLANYIERQKNTLLLMKNVKFITWNYDNQIERALTDLMGLDLDTVFDNIHSFPYCRYADIKLPDIVHLNGMAGIHKDSRHEKISSFFQDNDMEPSERLNSLLVYMDLAVDGELQHSEFFSYAWEDDEISRMAVRHANKIIEAADVLIIIGYSFPTFNDTIDKSLLVPFAERGDAVKIYYQDPNASNELLTSRFGFSDKQIVLVKSTKQFTLPLEVHGRPAGWMMA